MERLPYEASSGMSGETTELTRARYKTTYDLHDLAESLRRSLLQTRPATRTGVAGHARQCSTAR